VQVQPNESSCDASHAQQSVFDQGRQGPPAIWPQYEVNTAIEELRGKYAIGLSHGDPERSDASPNSYGMDAPTLNGIADAYDSAATDNVAPRAESYRLARLAVDKALALDPNDADAFAMRAFIRMNIWDWTGAEDDIHRSLNLRKTSSAVRAGAKPDPLDTYTLGELAYAVYPRLGRFEDSDRLFSKLRDINANGLYINAAQSLNAVFEGSYDLALRLAESETDVAQREMALSIVYTAMGKTLEAKQALDRTVRLIDG
jgi:tetratricopeptide (TPR) repeat protein